MIQIPQTADAVSRASLWAAGAASLLPLIAFGLIMVFLLRRPRWAAGTSIAAVTGALAAAFWLLWRHWGMTAPADRKSVV